MALETATYIDALVTSNPDGADARSTADDHLRLIKAALKRSFPMVGGAVSASHAAISRVNDLSQSAQAQLNELRDGSATAKFALVATTCVSASSAQALNGVPAGYFARNDAGNDFLGMQRITEGSIYAGPGLYLKHPNAPAGQQMWLSNYVAADGHYYLTTTDDSATYGSTVMQITRIGATPYNVFYNLAGSVWVNGVDLQNPVQLNGVPAASYARLDTARTFSGGTGNTPVTASPTTGTVQLNCSSGDYHRLSLTGNVTLDAPLAPRPGQVLVVRITQGGSGSYTVTWNSVFRFAQGVTPTLSTAVGAHDVFAFIYDDLLGYWLQAGLDVKR